MIHFKDGRTMTFEEAAQRIRAEGRLGILWLWQPPDGPRCAWGVIVNATVLSAEPLYRAWVEGSIVDVNQIFKENDEFLGTREERAAHMADWFDRMHLEDSEINRMED